MMKPQPPDFPGPAVNRLDIQDNPLDHRIFLRHFKLTRQLTNETVDDRLFFHADHRIERATHPDIGDIRGPIGQDALIGGLDMGMGPVHG